jgi:hypothetical protein
VSVLSFNYSRSEGKTFGLLRLEDVVPLKKVLFIMLIVMLLVALAAPVFADKGGIPNENAAFGQTHAENDDVKGLVIIMKANADAGDMNLGQHIKTLK